MPAKEIPDYIEGLVMPNDLSSFLVECFVNAGLNKVQANAVVDQMVTASLRGVDTHGVVLSERYLKAIKSGEIKSRPKIKRLKATGGLEVMDGDFGAGQYTAELATKDAIRLASKNGIGAVWVVNMSHCAMLAQYGLMIAKKGMAGLLFTNSGAGVAPWGGHEKVFGSNPLCFSFPYRKFPIAFDAATTAGAGMKVALAKMEGKQIPAGWALDKEGRPTTDPNKVDTMLPFGGHKGYAMMFMVEMYSGVLGGGRLAREVKYRDSQGGLYVQAIDIKKATRYKDYLDHVDKLAGFIKASERPDGDRVYIPGEIEAMTSERRSKEGIPIHKDIWSSFARVGADLGVALPEIRRR